MCIGNPTLENQLQPQLKGSAREGSGRLAEFGILEAVVCGERSGCDQKIRTVEDIERSRLELQVESLGKLEVLTQRHIGTPLPRASEGVATQSTDAS